MWVGFLSKTVKDESKMQKVFYLSPINDSPTNKSVVRHTMKQALQIKDEVKQPEIVFSFDLAIYKVARQIQSTDKPDSDKIFFNSGKFHLDMASYHADGILIDGCGLMDVLVECEIIASRSVNGLVKGKHYNRCKRVHSLVALE